jgi:hypothetical protein
MLLSWYANHVLIMSATNSVINRTSATNGSRIYNNNITDPAKQHPDWVDFTLRPEQVSDGFILLALLEDYAARDKILRVPHGGDQKDRFTDAIRERNARMAASGQPEWAHYCSKCTRVYHGGDGEPMSTMFYLHTVSVVLMSK